MTFGNYLTIPTNKTINHQQSSAKYSQKYSTLYNTIKSDAITDCNKNHAAINVVVIKRKILIYCREIRPLRTVKNIFNDFHQKYFWYRKNMNLLKSDGGRLAALRGHLPS